MARILKYFSVEFVLKGIRMEKLREFLEALLNREIQNDEKIKLSSAQTARLAMWAHKNNFGMDLSQIKRDFTLSSITLSTSNPQEMGSQTNSQNSKLRLGEVRLGNDIQLVSELFPENEPLNLLSLQKFFTKYEITYANATNLPKVTLTGIFSLKESLIKAGASYNTYLDIEITHANDGVPIFYGYSVSISHSGDYAASVALKIS